MDCSQPGTSVHKIFQARVLEWVAISFSRGSSWPWDQTQVSLMEGRCFTIWATRESKQKQKRLREGNKNTQKNYTENGLNEPDYHKGVVTHLEPDILECEVKWTLGRITINKAGGGDRIPAELFKILKDAAAKVLHSICQQIWKTHQCPQVEKHHFSFQSQRIV